MNRRNRPTGDKTGRAVSPFWLALLAFLLVLGIAGAVSLRDLDLVALLGAHRAELVSWTEEHLLAAAALFVLLYILAIAFSLPVNFAMTASSGFLFGFMAGTVLSTLAVTAGAVLVFRIAKANLGDRLRERILDQGSSRIFERMDRGFRKNATLYLLLLRLTPTLPSIVPNAAPAFFAVGTRTFLTATLLGVVPNTLVTAWIGSGLSDVLASGAGAAPMPAFSPYAVGAVLIALLLLAAGGFAFRRLRP